MKEQEDQNKTSVDPSGNKEPFHWSIYDVADCAKEIAIEYRDLALWSDHLFLDMVKAYIKKKQFEKLYKQLFPLTDPDQQKEINITCVNKEKLEEIIKFLYNYKDPQV